MTKPIRLGFGDSRADVSLRGAEILSWRCAGKELLWHGDQRYWTRTAPVLFPFCGWLNGGVFRHRGRAYGLPVHGFGPDAAFVPQATGANAVRLRLCDTPESRARFPFAFALTVDITLAHNAFSYAFTVENPGKAPLPYALGFHPGFRWPFDGGDKNAYRVAFARLERPVSERIAPGGLFAGETQPAPIQGSVLDIAAALTQQDSLVMLHAASDSLSFVAPGGARLDIATENFPHWVFWSLSGAEYLCIEGWTGQGDPVGFSGNLAQKPGMTWLKPGDVQRHSFAVSYRAAQT